MLRHMDLSIGQLSRLTGIPVKTIRYYSDLGLVPEARRTAAGYRHYDDTAFSRLELVRALRDLGVDLRTIGRVCERRMSIEDVARTNTDALDLHMRQLSLRRAALRRIAAGASTEEDVRRMAAFAGASADECRRILEDFADAVFAGRPDDPFAERMKSALPVLSNEPTDDQIDAWVELANLVQDRSFLDRVRQMAGEGARLRTASGISHTDAATQEAGTKVLELGSAAIVSQIDPASCEAHKTVDELVASFATAAHRKDSPRYRRELVQQLAMFSDARMERYWQLVGIINQLPAVPSMMPAYEWFIAALNASISQS